MDIVAFDFETANSKRESACSIAMVRVRDGEVIDSYQSFLRPNDLVGQFHRRNIEIHGITPDLVKDAPMLVDILPALDAFVGSDIVFAHNAAFDRSVLKNTCLFEQVSPPSWRIACSLNLSRKMLRLERYRLPDVAKWCGVEDFRHHDALADSIACAKIVSFILNYSQEPDVESLLRTQQLNIKHAND